jgi:RNA polymerase sigma-70 factor (ECF subfamily)
LGSDDRSDRDLVLAFQQGDRDAFAAFVDRHADRLYRMASAWLFDRSTAADAVQETFARTYRGLARFRFRAEPATWLVRVCRNVCHEQNRYTRRTVPTRDMSPLVDRAEEEPVAVPDRSTTREVFARLAALPPRQRDVVVLRILEGLSVRETARVMGCREGTVKAHLNKALGKLRLEWYADDD